MKAIQSINIWSDGINKEVTLLNAYTVSDNLNDKAVFYYQLLTTEKESVSEGNIIMDGLDYQGWLTNEYAYDFIATKLGLTIL